MDEFGSVKRLIVELMGDRPAGNKSTGHLCQRVANRLAGSSARVRISPAVRASVCRALRSLERKGVLVSKLRPDWQLGEGRKTLWQLAGDAKAQAEREAKKRAKAERERAKQQTRIEEQAELDAGGFLATAVAKLAKVLGLLSSDQDHEVVAAARQAEAIREKLGLPWSDMLSARHIERVLQHRKLMDELHDMTAEQRQNWNDALGAMGV